MNEHPDEQVAAEARDPNSGGIPQWSWPEWLTCAAISRDANGNWYAWDGEPDLNVADGVWTTSEAAENFNLLGGIISASVFPDVPWNESLRINPNRKAS